jgi:two-component system sensor histidine kinase UhpB
VTLAADDAGVLLVIEDDGVGFDPMGTFGPDHLGLSNMRERAAVLGGTFEVTGRDGGGTRIVARIPVDGGVS